MAVRSLSIWNRYCLGTYGFCLVANAVQKLPLFAWRSTTDGLILGTIVFVLAEVMAKDDRRA